MEKSPEAKKASLGCPGLGGRRVHSLILFAIAGALILGEIAFAQANILRRNLDEFVVVDKVQ
jgi:hypothetical protein